MQRKQNFQTIAWFWDAYTREILDLDPPYQRRSVWNQSYREYYVDTLLLGYPSPAIFLFERISLEGKATYFVVDGKQRLSTVFGFVNNEFPVGENATRTALRGKFFRELPDEAKRDLWAYQFTVEYLPSDEEGIINTIFDRINRNTARLTPQELRHAKFSGQFITRAEDAAERLTKVLGDSFPNIASQQRRQMKDVEFTASLLLLLEHGPQGYSAAQLDEEFSKRDDEWPQGDDIIARFDATLNRIKLLTSSEVGLQLKGSRLRNQADFYSLFGAISIMPDETDWNKAAAGLRGFVDILADEAARALHPIAQNYFEAARSASNDSGPRKTRIDNLQTVINDALK